MPCNASTKKGLPCKNKSTRPDKRCWLHCRQEYRVPTKKTLLSRVQDLEEKVKLLERELHALRVQREEEVSSSQYEDREVEVSSSEDREIKVSTPQPEDREIKVSTPQPEDRKEEVSEAEPMNSFKVLSPEEAEKELAYILSLPKLSKNKMRSIKRKGPKDKRELLRLIFATVEEDEPYCFLKLACLPFEPMLEVAKEQGLVNL